MKIASLLASVFLIFFLYFLSIKIPEESLHPLLARAGLWGPLVFILLAIMTRVVAPLSDLPLIFAGFYAFGQNLVFLVTLSSFIASIINFGIARRWGRSLVIKFVGHEEMAKVDKLTKNYGLVTLFLLRIFLGGVGDFVSYAAGLTSLPFLPYLAVSTLGMIPGTIAWYLIALQVKNPLVFTALTIALVVILSSLFTLAALIMKRWKR